MSINTKAIKSRLGSVKNTHKITRSMEKISAVKKQKFSNLALESKKYSDLIVDTNNRFTNTLEITEQSPIILKNREIKNTLFLILTSDRGLCGSFNTNILKATEQYYIKYKQEYNTRDIKVISLGKKGAKFAKNNNLELLGIYERVYETPSYDMSFEISRNIVNKYINYEIDEVIIIYTNYQSSSLQNIIIEKLLPFKNKNDEKKEEKNHEDYLIEPNISELQEYILLKTIDTKIYQAILDSSASEHTSRMIAMKNASDNANDLGYSLNLTYNKGRQSLITQEVSEIVAGIEAIQNIN